MAGIINLGKAPLWQAACLTQDGARSPEPRWAMPETVTEERLVYLPSRQREVRCRLWYEVTPLREGLFKYFLVGILELE